MRSVINQRKRENRETIRVVKAQVTISSCVNFAEGIVPTRFITTEKSLKFETFCVSFFAVTANFLFSKYWLQALVFKIPASYRPLLN